MNDFFLQSTFFALLISLAAYEAGAFLKKKTGFFLFNPLIVAIVLVIAFLLIFHIDYGVYEEGSGMLSYFLTPSTVAFAVPLYRRLSLLKEHAAAIVAGIVAGVLAGLVSTVLMAVFCGLDHSGYVTFLPKSITNAIGMALSGELGGMTTITVAAIVLTGIFGNVAGDLICRLFHIKEKISIGLAFGTAAHAMGTTKAMEIGEIEGAMSSLSIVVAGILTVVLANLFAIFL